MKIYKVTWYTVNQNPRQHVRYFQQKEAATALVSRLNAATVLLDINYLDADVKIETVEVE